MNASVIVWIADHFTDEHRAALDWLNKNTPEEINFFGLEIELWQIGDSAPAPKFNIISQPNDWERMIQRGGTELSKTQSIQQNFWADFKDYLHEKNSSIRPTKPLPQNWMDFAIGRSHFYLQAVVNTKVNLLQVFLVLDGPQHIAHFNLLKAQQSAIESEMGQALEWRENPHMKTSQIVLEHPGADLRDETNWPQLFAWLHQYLESFAVSFRPRIQQISPGELLLND